MMVLARLFSLSNVALRPMFDFSLFIPSTKIFQILPILWVSQFTKSASLISFGNGS